MDIGWAPIVGLTLTVIVVVLLIWRRVGNGRNHDGSPTGMPGLRDAGTRDRSGPSDGLGGND